VSSNSGNLKQDGSLELNKCLNTVPQSPSVISIYTGKQRAKIPGIQIACKKITTTKKSEVLNL